MCLFLRAIPRYMRKMRRRWESRFLLFVVFSLSISCDWLREEEPAPKPGTVLGPKKEVSVPSDFTGPIDPEWPPSHPGDERLQLEASRLFREEQKKQRQQGVAKSRQRSPHLFVEEGKIGDFHYLEVVMGQMRSPDDPMPLVVVLHGRGSKPTIPAQSFRDQLPLRFFIPQAPDRIGNGYTWLATYTQSGQIQLLTRSLSARVDQLAPAIFAFQKLRPTLGKPIVTGFSQGGILSYALATRYPNRFAAAFPLAGWLPPALYPAHNSKQKFPYIYAQQPAEDRIIPVEKARATVKALRGRGLRVDYRESPGGHRVTPAMDEEVLRATRKYLAGYFKTKPPVNAPRSQRSAAATPQ